MNMCNILDYNFIIRKQTFSSYAEILDVLKTLVLSKLYLFIYFVHNANPIKNYCRKGTTYKYNKVFKKISKENSCKITEQLFFS